MSSLPPLPIDEVLPELQATLARRTSVLLVAPPGAGKTTRVPLALLAAPWLADRRILVLEPRRIAARAAAEHMAHLLGEQVGEIVGLRARLATKIGPKTRIEVITEGVFTRLIIDDPSLESVGAVLFDEFHERSLDADLGLALARDAQAGLRPDLRLLVMSATLDAAPVSALLDAAPVIRSEGRTFPVTTQYLGRTAAKRIEDDMSTAVLRALNSEAGSILAFLPGVGEIRRVRERLVDELGKRHIDLLELHGSLDAQAQRSAIAPVAAGRRKVVLATSIAETSITIEGVRVVIDCGLQRVPRYEPDVGITRLETVRVSRASADQRRGRAGRTEPGVCYRLWSEPGTAGLLPFAEPEIRAADLSSLLLDCAAWGATDPRRLPWLDPPPAASLEAARNLLFDLGALDGNGRLTAEGERLRTLPLPPRLGHMLLGAAKLGAAQAAADIAAVLVERNLGGNEADLDVRLQRFRADRSQRAQAMQRMANRWAREASALVPRTGRSASPSSAELLALAYPDRIAKARGTHGQFLLANGRGARLDPSDPLCTSPYLVIAELAGAAARILLAARVEEANVLEFAGSRLTEAADIAFDPESAAVRARSVLHLGAIVIASRPQAISPDAEAAAALARGIAELGINRLPWTRDQLGLRQRLGFLRALDASDQTDWPDLSDTGLAATIDDWLAPQLIGCTRLADVSADRLSAALDALVPWNLKRRLDTDAPSHFVAPTGNRVPIDYQSEGAPVLAIRVQELFGLKHHPAIGKGRLPLTLHLLSPAGRPMQITRDLPRFWSGSWQEVKAEMRGRYPKHPWPDDPANAAPTSRAKPRR